MNKNKLVNNQYRKQEFNKRRKFRGAESFCPSNGDCPIFQNCLLEIDQLTNNWNELEEWVRKLIDDNNNRYELYKDDKLHYEYEISNIKYQNNMLVAFLDKMKEIKERKNENI